MAAWSGEEDLGRVDFVVSAVGFLHDPTMTLAPPRRATSAVTGDRSRFLGCA
jgi:hypothetical protein